MTLYYVAQLLAVIAIIVDMYRRPESAWTAADRQRGWWAGIFGVLAFFALGVAAVVLYLVLLLPRLGSAGTGGDDISDAFRKPPAG